METTKKSNTGRRFDEEFKREAARLAAQPGRTDEAVARDLGVSAWSISRWRKQFGLSKAAGSPAVASTPTAPRAAPAASVTELERRIRALERENADLREQRTILKKAVAIFSLPPR